MNMEEAASLIAQGVRAKLKALEYLATCGHFNAAKLEQCYDLLALDPLLEANVRARDIASWKREAERGIPNYWERLKWALQESVGKEIGFAMTQLGRTTPDFKTATFATWAATEFDRIGAIIRKQ